MSSKIWAGYRGGASNHFFDLIFAGWLFLSFEEPDERRGGKNYSLFTCTSIYQGLAFSAWYPQDTIHKYRQQTWNKDASAIFHYLRIKNLLVEKIPNNWRFDLVWQSYKIALQIGRHTNVCSGAKIQVSKSRFGMSRKWDLDNPKPLWRADHERIKRMCVWLEFSSFGSICFAHMCGVWQYSNGMILLWQGDDRSLFHQLLHACVLWSH